MNTILRSCSAVLLLAAAGFSAQAGDEVKYDLRGPAPKVGMVLRKVEKNEIKDADFTIDADGMIEKGKQSVTSVSERETKVLAVEGRFVTKYQIKHDKDETKTDITIDDETKTTNDVNDLVGTLVLSVKKGKEWKHGLIDAVPTEEQDKALAREPGWYDDDDIPEGKLAVGHSWEVSAAHMKKMLGPQVESVSGKAKATFVRVEKHRGELCAVIEHAGKFKAKYKEVDGESGSAEFDYKLTAYRSLRLGCELSTTVTGTIREVSKFKEGCVEVRTEVNGRFTTTETTTVTEPETRKMPPAK